jgi:hypothetical protein
MDYVMEDQAYSLSYDFDPSPPKKNEKISEKIS